MWAMTSPRSIKLYSHDYGPFPHIVRIALSEKGVQLGEEVEIENVDPEDKPKDFLQVSPTGKTPLLLVDGEPIFETVAVLECVDGLFDGGPAFQPQDPVARARDRSWTLLGLELQMDSFRTVMAPDLEGHQDNAREVVAKLTRLSAQLGSGPYFGGEQVGLVDFAYAALFLRMQLFEDAFGWAVLKDLPPIQRWAQALLARPSIRATMPSDFETSIVGFLRSRGGYITRARASA